MTRHYIYAIGRRQGPVKVGISSYPYGRVLALQTGCPFKLEVLHTREARDRADALRHEEHFHLGYQDLRLYGEWFNIDAESAIEGIDTGFEIDEYFAQRAREEATCEP